MCVGGREAEEKDDNGAGDGTECPEDEEEKQEKEEHGHSACGARPMIVTKVFMVRDMQRDCESCFPKLHS